eukprot:14500404-Ditylum_brightwellii.AAC.1
MHTKRSRGSTKKQRLQCQNTIRQLLASLDDSKKNGTGEELEEGLENGIDEDQALYQHKNNVTSYLQAI